jgi:hypothetical protein
MVLRRALYLWTGYWSFSPVYLKQEPLDPPNVFLATTMTVLALAGLRRLYRTNVYRANVHRANAAGANAALAARFAIVFVFFPLVYYFSHPETYYFRPVDPLIVVLAAYFVTGRFGRQIKRRRGDGVLASSDVLAS